MIYTKNTIQHECEAIQKNKKKKHLSPKKHSKQISLLQIYLII